MLQRSRESPVMYKTLSLKGNDPIGDTPIFQGTMIMGGRVNAEINYMLINCCRIPSIKGSPLWWFFPVFLPNVEANFCWINLLPVNKKGPAILRTARRASKTCARLRSSTAEFLGFKES